jgi:beta-phosphoglucomutase-like phosphatase (HAD superfamily)
MTASARTAVLFDLDSTLRNSRQRHHLSPAKIKDRKLVPADWHAYSAAGIHDEPMPGSVTALKLHWPHHQIHIISGSNASAMNYTMQWLAEHIGLSYLDQIQLRADGDDTENGLYKVRYARSVEARGVRVVLVYEDWPPAVQALLEAEYPTVCVNPCYPCLVCGTDPLERAVAAQVDNIGGGL